MPSKVEEARAALFRAIAAVGLGGASILTTNERLDAAVDALIAAVREEERERCVAKMNAERVEADETQHPSDFAYNEAIDHCIEAIRGD